MFRAVATELQDVIATKFGLTETDSVTGGPRDVLWGPDEIALRERSEQSSKLDRGVEGQMPFLSFWRIGQRLNRVRRSIPQAADGVHTDVTALKKYKLVPVDMVFQIEYWADVVEDFEEAMEDWFRWAWPPPELTLTDEEGVVFPLTIDFGDATDNSQLAMRREVGDIYRATFLLTVFGYVVSSGGTFNTINTIKWNIWDYSAYGDPDRAIKLKAVEITA